MLLATPGYEEATAEFIRQAVHQLMAAADPVYASLRHGPLPDGVSTIQVEVGRIRTTSPEVHLEYEAKVDRDDVIQGNLEQFHDALLQIAASHLEQFMGPFLEHVGVAAESVGNTVEADGILSWDVVLDAWEKAEWAVDDAGRVGPPSQIVASPAAVDRFRRLRMSEQQQQRLAGMVQRKQEEHVSRRRRRRLR